MNNKEHFSVTDSINPSPELGTDDLEPLDILLNDQSARHTYGLFDDACRESRDVQQVIKSYTRQGNLVFVGRDLRANMGSPDEYIVVTASLPEHSITVRSLAAQPFHKAGMSLYGTYDFDTILSLDGEQGSIIHLSNQGCWYSPDGQTRESMSPVFELSRGLYEHNRKLIQPITSKIVTTQEIPESATIVAA